MLLMRKSKSVLSAIVLCGGIFLSGCTITFSNISTDGANSAVEDEQTLSTDISPELKIPAIG